MEILEKIETDLGVPVITSHQATLWSALHHCHIQEKIPHLGKLFHVFKGQQEESIWVSNVHTITTDRTKKQFCHFIKTLRYEDIPPAVIERAKMMIMQTVGVSLCSAELKQVRDAMDIAIEMSAGKEGDATL